MNIATWQILNLFQKICRYNIYRESLGAVRNLSCLSGVALFPSPSISLEFIRLAAATTLIVVTVELVTDLQMNSYVPVPGAKGSSRKCSFQPFQEVRIKNRVRWRELVKSRNTERAGSGWTVVD